MSIKRLTKYSRNKFSIANGAKYFTSEIFQNYLVFMPVKNTLNIFMELL